MSIPIKIKRKVDGSIDNITFCPSVTIEKQVWESTLNRSRELEAENAQLKELLKECKEWLEYLGIYKYTEDSDDCVELLSELNEVLKC